MLRNTKLKVYLYFFEDYLEYVFALGRELESRFPNEVELIGLAARRRTVCQKMDQSGLPVKSYDYLGDLETAWLDKPLDTNKLAHYQKRFGIEKLRFLINCDRELAMGHVHGGVFARTKLRKMVESGNDENRWKYLVGVLDYFFDVFEREKPNLIFFNEFTMAYEVAAHMVATELGIPCLTGFVSRFSSLYFVSKSLNRRYPDVEKLYQECLDMPELLREDNLLAAQKYLSDFRLKPALPGYSIELNLKARRLARHSQTIKTFFFDIIKWGAIIIGAKGTKGFLRQRNGFDLLKTNLRVARELRRTLAGKIFENSSELVKEPFYYYPLHVEPESSTLVDAQKYANQIMIIQQAAKALPLGSRLLVKEHIPMIGLRPDGFYETIRRMPDVHLISPFTDNFYLIKNARAVITITGTAGWEALILQRPLVVVGETEYNCLTEGVTKADNIIRMSDYLKEAEGRQPIEDRRLISFIAACFQLGINFPARAYNYAHYGLDGKNLIEENSLAIRQIVDRLLAHIPAHPSTPQQSVPPQM